MNTISLISNVSYNTISFFEAKIIQLRDEHIIDWAHWIYHKPEEDEKKGHIHFVLKPSRRVDTNSLRDMFKEPVVLDDSSSQVLIQRTKEGEDSKKVFEELTKPLGVLPFDKTKSINDWLLYAIHDVRYLLKKGQMRKHHYEKSDVKSTDPDFLASQWLDAADPLEALTGRIIELKEAGESWGEILTRGLIPPNQVYYWRQVYYETGTDRNGRPNHEPAN